MQFNVNDPNLSAALQSRLVKELGEMALANFARDIIGDSLIAEKEALEQHNADLIAKTTADRQLILELRAERDAFRQERDALRAECDALRERGEAHAGGAARNMRHDKKTA